VRWLEEHPECGRLEELGAVAGLSATRLSRLFQRQMGMTVGRYRARQRLRRFFLLWEGPRQRTLMEAAFEAGFQSYVQFYRVFRDEMGRGPRQYAQMQKERSE